MRHASVVLIAALAFASPALAQTPPSPAVAKPPMSAGQKLDEKNLWACIAKALPKPTRDTPGPSAGSIGVAEDSCREKLRLPPRK